MKLKDLYKIKTLSAEIERYTEKARQAEERAEKITASFSSVPGGSSEGCKVENGAVEAVYYKNKINELRALRQSLQDAIYSCDDYLVKNALILRYDISIEEKPLTWSFLAIKYGTTPDSLRKACSRYLEKL